MRRNAATRALVLVIKAVGVFVIIVASVFPAYWMVTTALDAQPVLRGANLWPEQVTLDHFETAWVSAQFASFMTNSALVALATVAISGAVALLASIAVARYRFSLRKAMLILILIVQMVPLEALVIPLFLQARSLQLLNSLMGLVVVYLAFSLPFAIWMLRGFVAAVPKEIEEAAYIDGANWWQMFSRILLPLVAPGLVATSVFSFITAWNEFIFALVFLQDSSKFTVAIGLQKFFGENTADWGPIMAASTFMAVPIIVFFLLVQRNMVAGLASGAVKG